MFKKFSMFLVAGALVVAGGNSASAATGDCDTGSLASAPANATARAPAARAPATARQPGTQTIRRYSLAPSGAYRAPSVRSYRSNGSSGPSWTATRKILGY